LDFGKGTQHDQGATFFDPLNRRGRFGEKLVIGLVEYEKRTSGKFFDKGGEFGVGDASAGGVVRGSDEDEPNIGIDTGGEAGEVVMEVAIGDFFEGDAKKSGHESIDGESVGGGEDATLARQSVGVVAELDNFIGAATEDNVVWGEPVELCDRLAKGESSAVGIEVGKFERVSDRLEGTGGWAEWIFV
jgi:hypothetical protein